MKKSLRRALWAGAVVAVAAAAVPVLSASAAGTVTATFASASDWGSGHQGSVTITNGTDSTINGWTLEFTLPAGTSISSSWDADVTKSGDKYTAKNKSWSPTIAAGQKFSWGYIGTGAYKGPLTCTINGASCAGGTNPSPSVSPSASKSPSASPSASKSPSASPSASKSPSASPSASKSPSPSPSVSVSPPPPGDKWVVGYFAQWGVYARNYHVKNIDTSGSASKITHILYAFANTTNGRCSNKEPAPNGDTFADREKAYTADISVDGVADTWDQPLRGSFNQLLKLKKKYPHIKVIYSVGGWTWSKGFPAAAANLPAFADSCKQMIDEANGLAQQAHKMNLFDGIDIDWEFPMGCGDQNHCDTTSGFSGYKNMMQALRAKFGQNFLITSAITADASPNGKMNAADYAGGAQYMDKIFPMTYDFFGAFNAQGPTAPHSPLRSYPGIPQQGFNTEDAVKNLRDKGVPASKILLGIGFYGRGWSGVTQAAPGGSATGPAPGTYEQGIEDYKVLKTSCPATGTVGGTAYAKCGNNWYGYDTPSTIAGKLDWAKQQGLGGAFFWEFSGDTSNGELISAIKSNL